MEKLLLEMFEKAKENKKAFLKLKNLAVELQQYELGAELRQIQLKLFQESDAEKVETQNFITIERAKEVLQMLTTAINEVDNENFWQDLDKNLPSKKGGVVDTNTGEYIPFSEKK